MSNRKIYFDLSVLANTSAGTAVYAWEVCHRLMKLTMPLQVIPYTSPFRTVDRQGIKRAFNAVLRDSLWQPFMARMQAATEDYFIYPTPELAKFASQDYAIVIHDLGAWHDPSCLSWRGKLELGNLPKVAKKADRIFTVSDYTAQDVIKEFSVSPNKILVAPNGLSDIYKKTAEKLEKINNFYLGKQYFLHIGTFEPKKNLFFLLKAYEKYRQITPDEVEPVKLILTGGESWNTSNFVESIKASPYANDIIILGRVKSQDLPSLYKGAIALIFPSTFEGFGLPVIEALSQGTPVLVNANTSLTQFGKFGATVLQNFELELWAKQMLELVQTKRRITQSDIQKVKDYFDWDNTATIIAASIGIKDIKAN